MARITQSSPSVARSPRVVINQDGANEIEIDPPPEGDVTILGKQPGEPDAVEESEETTTTSRKSSKRS